MSVLFGLKSESNRRHSKVLSREARCSDLESFRSLDSRKENG